MPRKPQPKRKAQPAKRRPRNAAGREYVVLHRIAAPGGTRSRARLVVTGVPAAVKQVDVRRALERAGRGATFSEAGVAWGNHAITSGDRLPAQLDGLARAERVAWTELTNASAGDSRRFPLRLSPELYGRLELAAKREGVSLAAWIRDALEHAVEAER
jgi:hypothetical protein